MARILPPVGLAGALALTRVLQTRLYNVTPTDPVTFIGVVAILAALAQAASYPPARRAAQIEPIEALRHE